jgi:hypothetical protein
MIRHIMADGREIDSVEGLIIPTTGAAAAVYRIVADFANNPITPVCRNEEETERQHVQNYHLEAKAAQRNQK